MATVDKIIIFSQNIQSNEKIENKSIPFVRKKLKNIEQK
jgi:hypothetical protein